MTGLSHIFPLLFIATALQPKLFDDGLKKEDNYSLRFSNVTLLTCPAGMKSVLFNQAKTKLYGMNLENMSIYEFSQSSKTITREFHFKPTKGMGWDYGLNIPIDSFQEKPVEACFSNSGNIMWVSLHNAAGIVPLAIDLVPSLTNKPTLNKRIYLQNNEEHTTDTFDVPLIKTGKTPKVIVQANAGEHLLVSNWHSKTISILKVSDTISPFGKVIKNIPVYSTPRGIATDDKHGKSYVALMGSNRISVINNKTWKVERNIKTAYSPRHIVPDTSGRLFVSFNAPGEVACIDAASGKTLFKAYTHSEPRTIALSQNQKFLFVTCYSGNMIDVFSIGDSGFRKLFSLDCQGKPVGVDLYEDEHKLEAWVCTYMEDNLKVFTFEKSMPEPSLAEQ